MAISNGPYNTGQTDAVPRQTLLHQLVSEINGLINQIDDLQDNIGMSLGRLLEPRPAPPPTSGTGIAKAIERPSSLEGELHITISRLQRTVAASEDLANRLQSAV